MASTKKDIVIGNTFRPRSVVLQKVMRVNDVCKIKVYSPPSVTIEYRSDGSTQTVLDIELLDEYKLDNTISSTKPKTGIAKTKNSVPAASIDSSCVQSNKPPKTIDHYPHSCPRCQSPAYVGLLSVDCSKGCFN